MTKTNTMELWEKVSKTDPKHTKKVEFGRKFTAIDAHYQVQEATRAFGPVGQGWGYINGEPIFKDSLVFVPVTVWHGDRSNSYGPLYGGAELISNKGKTDNDALKKAATDGLTKALSHLGFNADVFLGKFDDNKYVADMQREFKEAPACMVKLSEFSEAIVLASTTDDLIALLDKYADDIDAASKVDPSAVMAAKQAFAAKKKLLNQKAT